MFVVLYDIGVNKCVTIQIHRLKQAPAKIGLHDTVVKLLIGSIAGPLLRSVHGKQATKPDWAANTIFNPFALTVHFVNDYSSGTLSKTKIALKGHKVFVASRILLTTWNAVK